MRKRSDGSLTVEASLVLIFFVFVVMLFLSFGRVYRAQNYVSHALMQTTQAIAQDYYVYDKAVSGTAIGSTASSIYNLLSAISDLKPFNQVKEYVAGKTGWTDLKKGVGVSVFKSYMSLVLGEDTDDTLIQMGLQNGIDSLEFEKIEYNNGSGDISVHVKYKVQLPFPFLGYKEMELEQTAQAHIWKTE